MGTKFNEIYDLFMTLQDDFRLITLFNSSQVDYENYLEGWLIPSLPEFDTCDQSLAYSGTTFTETLTQINKNILADLMKKRWLEKEIDDIKQMNNFITDKDFNTHSNSQNMEAKRKRYIEQKEEISQKLVDYGLKRIPMANWQAGIFWTE
jgi:hypothetical protein